MTLAVVARLDARPTDESLVAAARAGVEEAKAELFHRHGRAASDMAYRLLGRDGEVEDAVQEGFVIAYTTLASLADRPSRLPSPWMAPLSNERRANPARRGRDPQAS